MTELENVYHLELESLGVDADDVERWRPRLRREGTDARWEPRPLDGTIAGPPQLIARCGHLQRHPEDTPDVVCLPGVDGAATTMHQRDPDPRVVDTDLDAAAVDDIGAWLWTQLPDPIRAELAREFRHPARLVVHASGTASVLPWHRLSAACGRSPGGLMSAQRRPEGAAGAVVPGSLPSTAAIYPIVPPGEEPRQRKLSAWSDDASHQPLVHGRWDIWLHVEGGDAPDIDLQPRVLLLVGSQRQRPESDAAEHSVLDVVAAIRASGFHCDVAAGQPQILGFERSEGVWTQLDGADQVKTVIAHGAYDIVHYIGHSDATRRVDQSPLGAKALEFGLSAAGGAGERLEKLPLTELADALRDAPTRLVVLHACMTREFVASALLGPSANGHGGAVDAVVSMAAMAAPGVCAAFAGEFYARFQSTRSLRAALLEGRRTLRKHFPGFDWLPLLWTRRRTPMRLADATSRRIETYCHKLLDRERAFEGLFADIEPFDRMAIDVDVARARDANTYTRAHRVLADLPPGQPLRFADLMAAGGWWTLGGEPGAGKTTALRRYARSLAKDRARTHVPIYLPLASWLKALGDHRGGVETWLGQYLENDFHVPGLGDDLTRLGRDGKLVLLLDGFDEVAPELRKRLIDKNGILTELRSEFTSCRVVVATRRYQSARRLPQEWFGDAELRPLEPAEAVRLFRKIVEIETDTALARAHVDWFADRLECGARRWREIGRTPLLVAMLALQVLDGKAPASSRLAFFEQAFDVLCRGRHKHEAVELPHRDDALCILRFLAWRLTATKNRFATLGELEAWLGPAETDAGKSSAGRSDLHPPAHVFTALGDLAKWSAPPEIGATTPAAAFLSCVARHTLILGPEDTKPTARWRFWHRSFQAALCALHWHTSFVVDADSQDAGVDALLAHFDACVPPSGTRDLDREAVARHAADVADAWDAGRTDDDNLSRAQTDLIDEAWGVHTDDPAARDRDLGAAFRSGDKKGYRAVILREVSRGRALQDDLDPFIESFVLLADSLNHTDRLVERLLQRSFWLAHPVALGSHRIGTKTLARLLASAPELGPRATLLARIPESTRSDSTEDPSRVLDARMQHVDDPGELFLLHAARGRLDADRRTTDRHSAMRPRRTLVFERLPRPLPDELRSHLCLVPGRECDVEPENGARGVHLWRRVEAGDFHMGTEGGGPRGDETRRRVRIQSPFWIGAVPVTVGLFRMFAPQHPQTEDGRLGPAMEIDPAMPATRVSWYAARMFCAWLTHHAGALLADHLHARGFERPAANLVARLPTEAEWEFAARAGSRTRFFFGDDNDQLHHFGQLCSRDDPGTRYPVASHRGMDPLAPIPGANALGLFDVHGNPWEWCSDVYAPFGSSAEATVVDPTGPPSGTTRVLRGGSLRYGDDRCRTALRYCSAPQRCVDAYGFRIVLAVDAPGQPSQ